MTPREYAALVAVRRRTLDLQDAMQANVCATIYACAPAARKTRRSLRDFMLLRG